MAKLSVELNRYFFEEDHSPEVKLGDILALAGERVFGFLFVILALPSALPIPAAGYSIPFAIVMLLLAVQLIGGRERPWLPQRFYNGSIKLKTAQKFVKMGIPWFRRIEALSRPRLGWICTSVPGRIILGLTIMLMATFMMIPIPGTNTLPAIVIFVIGFGLLEDDGIISIAGLTLGAIVAVLIATLIWGGVNLIDSLKDWLKGLLR